MVSCDPETVTFTASVKISGDTPVLEALGSKDVTIAAIGAILVSLDAEVSCDSITTEIGTSATVTPSIIVNGGYSDWSVNTLSSSDYDVSWSSLSSDLADLGFTFENGVLTVESSADAGVYAVPVRALVSSGDVSTSADVNINVTVRNIAPVLSSDAADSLEFDTGTAITPITITATSGTNLEWTTSGTLPDGLSGAIAEDAKSFTISGTADATAAGNSFEYTVTASNDVGSASKTMTLVFKVSEDAASEDSEGGTGGSNDGTVTATEEEVLSMPTEEKQEITELSLVGTVTDLAGVLKEVPDLTSLDLTEADIETVSLDSDSSVKNIDLSGNTSVKTINITGGAIEVLDANGCENLSEANLEGCESLVSLDVSETSITSLNVRDCVNLGTVNCASCDITVINLEGCESLGELDCRNNSLPRLNMENFSLLRRLRCENQRIKGWIASRVMNIIELFDLLEVSVSATDADMEDIERVTNLKAFDASGNEIPVTYDKETGDLTFGSVPLSFSYDYDTDFAEDGEEVLMDVTVSAAESSHDDTELSSHGGGCNAGFGMLALLLMNFAIFKKRSNQ